jgi:hypothetical protein
VKLLLETLTEDERVQVKNFASKIKKKSYRRIKRESHANLGASGTIASEPVDTASVPIVPPPSLPKWFDEWSPEDIIALDVEMVTPEVKEIGNHIRGIENLLSEHNLS